MKHTVKSLLDLKGKRKAVLTCAFDKWTALAAEFAGMDMVLTWAQESGTLEETLLMIKLIRRAAPNTLLAAGLPKQYAYISEEEAVRCALICQEQGADVIYSSGMPVESFEGLSKRGIPCVGHVGYLPVRDTWIGGPRSVGKFANEAKAVYDQVKAFENAGCIGVEMELVPAPVAALITKNTRIMTISMGSGPDCDAQFLFSCDLLGMHDGRYPRHSKTYMNYLDSATNAFQQFRKEVLEGTYPNEGRSLPMGDDELLAFEKMLKH